MKDYQLQLGAIYQGDKTSFEVWAPLAKQVDLKIVSNDIQYYEMEKMVEGYFRIELINIQPGTLYQYRLDGEKERPDPASRFQPEGVHGPSMVVDPEFDWNDTNWKTIPISDYIIYELHVGTFTRDGTFDAVIPHLSELKALGITAIEIMPIAQFPGGRNWGYDGVNLFAAQNTYGGPDGFRRLVNACHAQGIAVVLDVVYNHLGPEGNYLWDYGHYFNARYKTPWGEALNFDDRYSDEVRRFFIENALYWMETCHVDALRLDAVHAILDFSAKPFLQELSAVVEQHGQHIGRRMLLIAESDLNDSTVITPREKNGWGHDAQWTDDFHHALHALLTGETDGYYSAFGSVAHLAKALEDNFVYSGQYNPYRKRRFGNNVSGFSPQHFVVYAQNHDQVGNRMHGDRLSQTLSFEGLKLAAGAYLLSPFVPMLFMGEEYGETAPFPYFISHNDQDLVKGVQEGRKEEFAAFAWKGTPPDPASEKTFTSAYLNFDKKNDQPNAQLFQLYQELIALRKKHPSLKVHKDGFMVHYHENQSWLMVKRGSGKNEVIILYAFAKEQQAISMTFPKGKWKKRLDSADPKWGGSGSAVAEEILSDGKVDLALNGEMFVLFERGDHE